MASRQIFAGFIWNNVEKEWFYTDSVSTTVAKMFGEYYGLVPSQIPQHWYLHDESHYRDYVFRTSIVRVRPVYKTSELDKMKKALVKLQKDIRETRDLADGWVKVEKKG